MKQHLSRPEFTPQETQLIRRLRQQPELLVRLQSILNLAHVADSSLKSADEVEELLIRELRQLDHSTMNQWATQAEVRVSTELKEQDATVRRRKKTLTRRATARSGSSCRAGKCSGSKRTFCATSFM